MLPGADAISAFISPPIMFSAIDVVLSLLMLSLLPLYALAMTLRPPAFRMVTSLSATRREADALTPLFDAVDNASS